jgi:MFS family permease
MARPYRDDWLTTTVISLLYPLGPAAAILMPLIVGALIDGYGYSPEQAGNIAAAEGLGIVVASFAATLWIRRVRWVRAIAVATLAYAGINVASSGVPDYGPLLALRFAAGAAGGCVFAVAVAALGDHRQPDRAFGLAQAVQGAVMLALFGLAPAVVAAAGTGGLYNLLAVYALVSLLVLGWFPDAGRLATAGQDATAAEVPVGLIWTGLAASVVYFINVFGLWAFVERMGQAAGLQPVAIALALGMSQVVAIAGGLAATWAGDRYGRAGPLLVVAVGQSAAAWALLGQFGLPAFYAITGLFQALFIIGVSYQMGVIAKLDRAGRYLVMMTGAQGLGAALGPALAGALVGEPPAYGGVVALTIGCCLASTAVFLAVVWRSRRA